MAKKLPKYCLHKATGQAYVTLAGKPRYLAKYGTPESKSRYRELVDDWTTRHTDACQLEITIGELSLLYWEHAQNHYRKNGLPTSEQSCIKTALRFLNAHQSTRIADFGPRKLKAVQTAMIADGHCRKSINKHIGRLRRVFSWAVANEYCSPNVLSALREVKGLEKERTEARETMPVTPVPLDRVEAIKPYVTAPIWAMIQVQLLTGMRPGEVLVMRRHNLRACGDVWEYRPQSHKTEHHGLARTILIGPRAQAVIMPFFKHELDAYIFSPRDVRAAKPGATRQPGERYDRDAYRTAIQRGCERAFKMPAELRNPDRGLTRLPFEGRSEVRARRLVLAAKWREAHCWHPHQLRHNAGTLIRREADIETARAVLGHTSVATTEIYAEHHAARASEIMRRIG